MWDWNCSGGAEATAPCSWQGDYVCCLSVIRRNFLPNRRFRSVSWQEPVSSLRWSLEPDLWSTGIILSGITGICPGTGWARSAFPSVLPGSLCPMLPAGFTAGLTGFSPKNKAPEAGGFSEIPYSLMPSTRPFAMPTRFCIWLGMMILVA